MLPSLRVDALVRAGVAVVLSLALQGCLPKPNKCSKDGFNCIKTGCCFNKNHQCYARDESWAECKASCTPSYSESCNLVGKPSGEAAAAPAASSESADSSASSSSSTGSSARSSSPSSSSSASLSAPAPPPPPPPAPTIEWMEGTWTSAYWDCCKPSCSEKGKGHLDYPVSACHAKTGKKLDDASADSVCEGGVAGMCPDQSPFKVHDDLSMGFVAVGASGKHGLKGDVNCGQCYEWVFSDKQHTEDKEDPWGGAHKDLQGKRMVVQVVHSNFEPFATHSFDLLIPGSGQRGYDSGCKTQFHGFAADDFDCGMRYGGCQHNSSCAKMPDDLQDGCSWRHEWYRWLKGAGQTNMPFVKFRRVQCPERLTTISGASPTDDMDYPFPDTS